jgi:hypothetical protein
MNKEEFESIAQFRFTNDEFRDFIIPEYYKFQNKNAIGNIKTFYNEFVKNGGMILIYNDRLWMDSIIKADRACFFTNFGDFFRKPENPIVYIDHAILDRSPFNFFFIVKELNATDDSAIYVAYHTFDKIGSYHYYCHKTYSAAYLNIRIVKSELKKRFLTTAVVD